MTTAQALLLEEFRGGAHDSRLSWFCPPPVARIDGARGRLVVEPAAQTDFWQRTHYGFRADNGHVLQLAAQGNFVVTTCVTSQPRHQYDQAGLMLRVSEDCWLKTSVEAEPDDQHDRLGVVVTNHGYSDWSTQSFDKRHDTVWLRIRAETSALIVESSLDGQRWEQLRVAHLAERAPETAVSCGLYACSPKASGYRAEFHFLRFEPGLSRG